MFAYRLHIDIDECDGSSHGCSQICANTPGSYTCDCNHGYVLNRDGRICDGKSCPLVL